jgi:putative PIN family toxin of toxin-antitoxin system
MFKAVYDTNVVVSGLISSTGIPALLLDLVFSERIALVLSAEVFDEYERVIRRPKFTFSRPHRDAVLERLRSLAQWVETQESVTAAKDPDDNRFLECA